MEKFNDLTLDAMFMKKRVRFSPNSKLIFAQRFIERWGSLSSINLRMCTIWCLRWRGALALT